MNQPEDKHTLDLPMTTNQELSKIKVHLGMGDY